MSSATTRPSVAGLSALALAAASTLLVVAPAAAAPPDQHLLASNITPVGGSYLGWHFETGTGSDVWNGLQLGAGADSYALEGNVSAGAAGAPTDGTALGALITGASVTGTGDVLLEIPVSVGTVNPPPSGSWGTLRSVNSVIGASPSLSDQWVSSKDITLNGAAITANTPMTLGDLLDELDRAGDVRYSGSGVWASAQFPPAVVSSVTFNGATTSFGRPFVQTAPTSTVAVKQSDIRPDESTYTGWHEGYVNATPAYEVKSDGLHLGGSANSQIIDGLATPLTSDPFALLGSYAVTVVSGEAFAQIPVFFGPGSTFTTLRSAAGYTAGRTAPVPADLWQSSKAIPATATTAAIAANTAVPLGDLLEALIAHGSVQVLAFGVLAQAGAPAVVSSIAFNGVNYTFAAAPELAATGAESVVPLSIVAGTLLLLGGGLLLFRRRAAR